YHLFVTYDGSKKASGVKLYVNGNPEPARVTHDQLKGSLRTPVPFKLAQRHTASRLDNLVLQDVRLYGRALDGVEVSRLAKTPRAAWLLSLPADKRPAAERNELFDWWLLGLDETYQKLAARVTQLQQEEATIKARGTIAHVMQEKPGEPTAYVLFRGEY